MKKITKRLKKSLEVIGNEKVLSIEKAVETLLEFPKAKFDESVDLSFNLGIDPKHADQLVRGKVTLPNGTGKTVKVAVFAQGDDAQAAKDAGADYVGFKDLAEKIKGGWFDFDVVIAAQNTMSEVGKLGKVLGPKGLMPSPKAGTVTPKVADAVKEVKAGRIEFRVDKGGTLHMIVGKRSFTKDALVENVNAAIQAIIKAKPAAAKGQYIKSVAMSSTMSPGIGLNVQA